MIVFGIYTRVYIEFSNNEYVMLTFLYCVFLVYEGKPVGTPDAGAFFRVVEEHKIQGLFTAPTALRASKYTLIFKNHYQRVLGLEF